MNELWILESYPCRVDGVVAVDAEGSGIIAQARFGDNPGSVSTHGDYTKEMDEPFALMHDPETGSAEVYFFCTKLLAQSFFIENSATGVLVPTKKEEEPAELVFGKLEFPPQPQTEDGFLLCLIAG